MGVADESKQATGNAWGDDISEGRKAELEAMLQDWEDEADHGKRRGPFDNGPDRFDVQLTGADVYWLSARVLSGNPVGDLNWETIDVAIGRLLEDAATAGDLAGNSGDDETGLEDLHLEGAILWETDLRGALLWGAHLEHAKLNDAHLEGAVLTDALLQSASLFGAHLEGAVLRNAHLEMADLEGANLEAASLDGAHLEQTNLRGGTLGWVRHARSVSRRHDCTQRHLARR